MVDDPEIEHSVEALVGRLDCAYVSHGDFRVASMGRNSPLGARHHFGIEIDPAHLGRAELPEDDFHSEALPAANLQCSLALQTACHAKQKRSLIEPLHHPASGVVEHHSLDGIQPHDALPSESGPAAGVFARTKHPTKGVIRTSAATSKPACLPVASQSRREKKCRNPGPYARKFFQSRRCSTSTAQPPGSRARPTSRKNRILASCL